MTDTGFIIGERGGSAAGAADAAMEVVETTTQTFARDVLEPSRRVPVLVDFWAPWCGPCKQLAPVLEKAVRAAKGAVKLVKMNIDEHPAIAGQLGIRSIPAVIAFKDGRPLDGFMGALPESQVRDFIARVAGPIGDDAAALRAEADAARAAGDIASAAELYGAVIQENPEDAAAIAGLAHCYIEAGRLEEARRVLAMAPTAAAKDPAIQAAESALKLREQAAELGDAADLERRVAVDPSDYRARFDLAVALAGAGRREEALDQLFAIVKAEPEWNEGAARKQLLELFEAWGPKDPATIKGRRRLSSLLFA